MNEIEKQANEFNRGPREADGSYKWMCENCGAVFVEAADQDPTYDRSKDGTNWPVLCAKCNADVADATKRIREAAANGKVVFPEKAVQVFPLNFRENPKDEQGNYKFKYVALRGAWSERTYPEHPQHNNWGGFSIEWGCEHLGFGTLDFRLVGGTKDEETGEIKGATLRVDNEMMSREFVRQALAKLAENVILDDPEPEVKPKTV